MKKNVNVTPLFGYIPHFEDGSVIVCQVDQFAVKDPSLFKENGFPRTDIGIIDRMSSSDVDPDIISHISQRMVDISSHSPYDGMTDEEMLRVLRPANVQTATEFKFYSESVYNFMREKTESLRKSDTTTTTVDDSSGDSVPSAMDTTSDIQ